jgi:hypothetical protein
VLTVTEVEVKSIEGALLAFNRESGSQNKRIRLDDLAQAPNNILKQFSAGESAVLKDEVQLYLEAPCLSIEADPLHWWRTQGSSFPRLRALARKTLYVFASSIFCEEVNSIAGFIVNPRRTSLSSTMVKHLVFLRVNQKYFPGDYV